MVALDIEKAFNSIWHDGLLHKMYLNKFPIYIIKIVASFIKNRFFFVKISNSISQEFPIPAGVPQGSCLSPTLFNIFTSDLKVNPPCQIALFADDLAIYTSNENPNIIINDLESELTKTLKYYYKWKIKVNETKTQAIFFTRRRAVRFLPHRDINIGPSNVQWSNEIKYLGVLLDKKLLFQTHIDYTKERAQKLIRILYSLINRKSKLNLKNKMLIYKSIFKPMLLYACSVWGECANCHKNKLQVTQNKCLKLINNLPFYYSTKKLHKISNINPIQEAITKQTNTFLHKCQYSDNPLIAVLST